MHVGRLEHSLLLGCDVSSAAHGLLGLSHRDRLAAGVRLAGTAMASLPCLYCLFLVIRGAGPALPDHLRD